MICYSLKVIGDGIFVLHQQKIIEMKTYLIQRNVPGAGNFDREQLKLLSQKSCDVLDQLGPKIQWQHSYVTGDNLWCIYKAENEELLYEHARLGGFPINAIHEVVTMISPATAERPVAA
jgi:hypothetical protein